MTEGGTAIIGTRVLRNIGNLTLAIGALAGGLALAFRHADWAKGVVLGAVLAWLNFRWIKRGVGVMLSAAAERESGRGGGAVVLLLVFRYVLLGGAIYVIFNYIHVPLLSIAVGLCALGAATIAASVWEILSPAE
jgi:ATP synthase I chain